MDGSHFEIGCHLCCERYVKWPYSKKSSLHQNITIIAKGHCGYSPIPLGLIHYYLPVPTVL